MAALLHPNSVDDHDAFFPRFIPRPLVFLPALLARRPGHHQTHDGSALPHDHRAFRAGRRRIWTVGLLLGLSRSTTCEIEALQRVRSLRRKAWPSLPVGGQLHRIKEPQILHRLSRDVDRHVRVDVVRWHNLLHRGVRRQLRGRFVGGAGHRQHLHAVGRLGHAQRTAALHLGHDSADLPEVPNHLLGNDDQREDEPRQVSFATHSDFICWLWPFQVSTFHREGRKKSVRPRMVQEHRWFLRVQLLRRF